MVYFHLIFDLSELYGFNAGIYSPFNHIIGELSAIIFIFISGVSSIFSKSNVKRGLRLFFIAMLLTLITYVFARDMTIKFGILHFLSICMIIYPLLNKLNPFYKIIFSVILILAGFYTRSVNSTNDMLFFLGIHNSSFSSGDYYPLIPWLGLYLFGCSFGKLIYSEKKSVFKTNLNQNILTYAGKHSLVIYILHQPIIILFIEIFMQLFYTATPSS